MDRTSSSLRKSGIEPLGEIGWGSHVCHFFETASDVIDTVRSFFAAGLEQGERCVWLIADPVDDCAATDALRGLVYAQDAVEIIDSGQWFRREGSLDPESQRPVWDALLEDALRRGFTGLRVSGCEGWQSEEHWTAFGDFEEFLDRWANGKPVLLLCSYPLSAVGAADIIDIALRHHRVILKRKGVWEVLETPDVSKLRARNRQQSAVAALSQTAIRERDLHAVMTEAVSLAASTLGTGRSLVWQMRPETCDLIVRAGVGWSELPSDATIPLDGRTASGFVLHNDTAVIVDDARTDGRFDKSWVLTGYGVVTLLSAGIRGRERPWGILSVHSMTPRSFNSDDVEFLQSMANVLALAIERKQFEEAQTDARAIAEAALAKLRAIENITDAALGRMSMDQLLSELLARLRQTLTAEFVGVTLLDEQKTHFTLRASVGHPLERLNHARVPLTSPISGRIMQSGHEQIFDELPPPDAPEWDDWPAQTGLTFASALGAPLIVEGNFIGAVVVASTERRRFNADELELLRLVADRVAPPIERGRLLEQIRGHRKRLEALSHRLLTVQEEERRHLAVELHDQLGQMYTALKIKLDSVQRGLHDQAASTQLAEAIGIVDGAAAAVRNLALDLRPSMLDDLGLGPALRWYADRFARQTGVSLHLRFDRFPSVDSAHATVLFRVAQEALTNIARHANARNVWLEMRTGADALQLTVRDDGSGFDVTAARQRALRGESLGLLGMEERVSLMSGTLEVTSVPNAGTTVCATIPLSKAEVA
ncbi:MAG: GAF domain-containing protein [Thermoanaerobaculia bacterium]